MLKEHIEKRLWAWIFTRTIVRCSTSDESNTESVIKRGVDVADQAIRTLKEHEIDEAFWPVPEGSDDE